MTSLRSRLLPFLFTAMAMGSLPAIGEEKSASDLSSDVLAQAADEVAQARMSLHGEAIRSMAFMAACGRRDLFEKLDATVTHDWAERVASEVAFCISREKKTGQTCVIDRVKSDSDKRVVDAYVNGTMKGAYRGFLEGVMVAVGIPELKSSYCSGGVKIAQEILGRKRM